MNIERFLVLSKDTLSVKFFVHPVTLKDLSVSKLRYFLCKFIRMGDPSVCPKTHDLRKLASSFAFFKAMKIQDICELVGWSSIRVFKKHYLKHIQALSSSIICLGSEVPASQ